MPCMTVKHDQIMLTGPEYSRTATWVGMHKSPCKGCLSGSIWTWGVGVVGNVGTFGYRGHKLASSSILKTFIVSCPSASMLAITNSTSRLVDRDYVALDEG